MDIFDNLLPHEREALERADYKFARWQFPPGSALEKHVMENLKPLLQKQIFGTWLSCVAHNGEDLIPEKVRHLPVYFYTEKNRYLAITELIHHSWWGNRLELLAWLYVWLELENEHRDKNGEVPTASESSSNNLTESENDFSLSVSGNQTPELVDFISGVKSEMEADSITEQLQLLGIEIGEDTVTLAHPGYPPQFINPDLFWQLMAFLATCTRLTA